LTSKTVSQPIDHSASIYVAGHRGLVGSGIWRHLDAEGFRNLIGWSSSELDLRDKAATLKALRTEKPDIVIMAAARVGGIMANQSMPVEFLNDNLDIQSSVFQAAHEVGVDRLLFLGSSCIYPRLAPQPINESSLLTGPLEPTNEAYAIAKIAGILQIQAYRREYGRKWISAMPTNLYGPGDNFDLQTSHVLPALIRKFHEAKNNGELSVTLWGTGSPLREFLHVDDVARACLYLLENYDDGIPINIGCGEDISIKELANLISKIVGFRGEVHWDVSKPDGTPRKLLDTGRINSLGWRSSISLESGIANTYRRFSLDQGLR
jgi:GDP-L-fucose synthase